MQLAESGENYLENILILQARNGQVRSSDIATSMGFSKPSVSRAVHLLKDNGYLTMDSSNLIELTEQGLAVATAVYEKHVFLREFLIHLGVSEENAAVDACKIEHVISDETFEKLKGVFPDIYAHIKENAFDDEFILAFHRENQYKQDKD